MTKPVESPDAALFGEVWVVLPAYAGGGAEFVARTWQKELIASGYTVRLVLYADDATTTSDMSIATGGRIRLIRRIISLAKLLRLNRPAYVVGMMTYSNILVLLAAKLSRRSPVVAISERNIASAIRRDQPWQERVQYHVAKSLYRRADLAIAISHPVAAEFVAAFNVPASRVRVVFNPAVAKIAERGPREDHSNTAGPATGEHLHLVAPARLVVQKNSHLVLETAAYLQSRGRSVSVTFFGAGPLKDDLEAQAAHLSIDVEFPGWDERWFEHCLPASIVVLPSSYEGFGNVLVEAAASGMPVVTSSTALGVADAVIPGVTGTLAASLRPEDLADAVLSARNIGGAALDAWLDNFSAARSAQQLVAALRSIDQPSPRIDTRAHGG